MSDEAGSALYRAGAKAGFLNHRVRVEHERFERHLRFGSTDLQSAMDLRQPDRLVLDYTRLMMGYLLFQPHPRHMLMIGLGGGSLPKFCHRHSAGTDITVAEIEPLVVALREQFEVPADGHDFRVVQADGADLVTAADDASVDVIMVDGFSAQEMSPALGTPDFYAQCARALRPGGVMVCNLHELDIHFGAYLERISQAFHGRMLPVSTRECGNSVVFARRDLAIDARLPRHLLRPAGMPELAWAGIEAELHDVLRRARDLRAFV